MLLPLGLLALVFGAIGAWLAWRRLPRPWNRRVAIALAMPAVVVGVILAGGMLAGRLGCEERTLWRRSTDDGAFDTAAASIACAGGVVTYNVTVEERRPDGRGKVRAIWRSLESPVPVAIDHVPPARFVVRAHDGSPEARPVPPAAVVLEGGDLTPTPMWSFVRGRPQ
ncbi:MAG: hypothetical protein IT561_02300 [Alphaproteobacteria bacterium]|nr:hypothetical protein [Alphaproteobacteria bacterium]